MINRKKMSKEDELKLLHWVTIYNAIHENQQHDPLKTLLEKDTKTFIFDDESWVET